MNTNTHSSYYRTEYILYLTQSLKELHELCFKFLPCEFGDTFMVRLNMMEHLAKKAFEYSLKVTYLDETDEYAPIAELLDNIYLQQSRNRLTPLHI